jgi:hypothetical protein
MYDAAKHTVFSQRVRNFVSHLQALREEAARLDLIYTNEAESGSHGDYGDTDIATATEHTEAVVFMRSFETLMSDNVARLTPFLQQD